VEEAGVVRELSGDEFPLVLGGPTSSVRLPGLESGPARAYAGLSEGEVFLQPAEKDRPVVCNGSSLRSSQWLRHGDLVELGGAELAIEEDGDKLFIRVRAGVVEAGPEIPVLVPPGRARPEEPPVEAPEVRITPIPFTPSRVAAGRSSRRLPRIGTAFLWLFLVAMAAAAWFVFTVEPVSVEVEPTPDLMRIEGALFSPRVSGRYLLRRGSYTVIAEKEGYRRLENAFEVTGAPNQSFAFALEQLPGRLVLTTSPEVEAQVAIGGDPVGSTPLEPLELAAGSYELSIRAPGFLDYSTTFEIPGPGASVELLAELQDNRGTVAFTSEQPGVTVVVAGRELGTVPRTAPIEAGSYRVDWLAAGFKPASSRLKVVAGESLQLAAPVLVPADGNLLLRSEPDGAAVTVDGVYRGQTPLDLDLSPNEPHRLELSKAGYTPASEEVRLAPGRSEVVTVSMDEQTTELAISSRPPGAEVLVDGELRGTTTADPLTVVLAGSDPYEIEVRKEGYVAHRQSVIPRPGLGQSLEVTLNTPEQEQALRTPPVITTAKGQEMRLVRGGKLQMGASRREPGRRPNETLREAELTRPFYVAVNEVSNAEFREFDPTHLSGTAGAATLEIDDHPVVQVSWAAAARYCNWLSEKDSLPPAYALRNGQMVPVSPMSTGYRLLTEAEWAWVARYPNGNSRKYAWGDSLPIPPGGGNYGDLAGASILGRSLPGYNDKYATTSPVGSFEANPLGIFNLGGNVAEWVNDLYAIDPRMAEGVEKDPFGPEDGTQHVIRGASWASSSVTALRLSYRDAGGEGRPDVGFRIARYAE
jgi:formylglycine-generating enzyme required for sulfatase activity